MQYIVNKLTQHITAVIQMLHWFLNSGLKIDENGEFNISLVYL